MTFAKRRLYLCFFAFCGGCTLVRGYRTPSLAFHPNRPPQTRPATILMIIARFCRHSGYRGIRPAQNQRRDPAHIGRSRNPPPLRNRPGRVPTHPARPPWNENPRPPRRTQRGELKSKCRQNFLPETALGLSKNRLKTVMRAAWVIELKT